MSWQGPKKDGITQSLINKFLQDPYAFYIYAYLGLEEYEEPEPNLVYGDTAHVGLEHIIAKPYTINDFSPEDWQEIDDIIDRYIDKNYPTAPATFPISIKRMIRLYDDSYSEGRDFKTEVQFAVPYTNKFGQESTLRGKVDGICEKTLVEHKFTSRIDQVQTALETPIDLQTIVYCFVTGCREIIYDKIRIPDTQWSLPPKRQYQRPSNYINELYDSREWGDFPVTRKRHLWLQQTHLHISDEQVERLMAEMVDPLLDRIWRYHEYVSDPSFDWQDPKCFNHLYYRTPIRNFDPARTQQYKCAYYRYLTNQIELEDLVPVTSYFKELPDAKENV
jgi:hypothetical protein